MDAFTAKATAALRNENKGGVREGKEEKEKEAIRRNKER